MRRVLTSVLLATLLAPSGGAAQETKRPEPKLEPVVVTATKIETPQERLGASVTVITEEELQGYNYSRVEDALRSVPGVEIQRSGGFGKLTDVRIRGANPQQVQILIDGMRVKSPAIGSFDFADLSLDGIERIEVVRGPQSTLYGADAIGGVINIITKKGAGPPTGTVKFEGGSHQTFREQVSTQGSIGWFNYSFSGSKLDSRGQQRTFNNDDTDQRALAARVGLDLPWDASLSATGRYSKSDIDVPVNPGFLTAFRDPDQQQQTEFYMFTLRYDQKVFPWWEIAARMGQTFHDQGFQNGPKPVELDGFPFNSQVTTRRREFELLSTWHMGKVNSLTLGAEHRNEFGRIKDAFRGESNTIGLFVQDELRLFNRLFLGAGYRFEDNDVFGQARTPRTSAALLIKETGTKLRAAYGEGFRAPDLDDLFFPDQTGLCPDFGNRNLHPERSKSWEAGVDQKAWENRIRLGATYFHNQFRDLITAVNIPPTPTGALFGAVCQQQANVGRAVTQGVEFAGEAEPLDWLRLNLNYTFTDTEDLATGRELGRFARYRFNAGVTVTPHPRLTMFVQSYIVSRQLDPPTDRHNPGYYRVDAGGTWRLLQRYKRMEALDFTLRIQNLTDNQYAEVRGFPALGLTALAGLRAQFK
jgi:vitamin B12 transporter